MIFINIRTIIFYLLLSILCVVQYSIAANEKAHHIEDLFPEDYMLLQEFIEDNSGENYWLETLQPPTNESIPTSLENNEAVSLLPEVMPTPPSAPPIPPAQQNSRAPQVLQRIVSPLLFPGVTPQGTYDPPDGHTTWPAPYSASPMSQGQPQAPERQRKKSYVFTMVDPGRYKDKDKDKESNTPPAYGLTFEDNTPRQSNQQQLICPTCDQSFLGTDKAYWKHRETCTTAQEGGPQRKRPRTGSLSARATAHTTQAAAHVRGMDPQAGNLFLFQNFQLYRDQIPPAPYPQPQLPYNPQNWAGHNISVQPQSFSCSWSEQGITCNQTFYRDDDLSRHIIEFHKRTCKFLVQIHNQWQLCAEGPFASQSALMNHIAKMHTDTN